MDNKKYIICPNCGAEYLPGEIYLPNQFTGVPKDVERDYLGKIIWKDGLEQNLSEHFICEKCLRAFQVDADITYKTSIDKVYDMDVEYVSELYKDRINLKED